MINSIPSSIQVSMQDVLQAQFGRAVRLKSFSFSTGGCINHAGKLDTTEGVFFLKWNNSERFPGMFEAEAQGLRLLHKANAAHIPVVIDHGLADGYQWLLLEFIVSRSKSVNYSRNLGEKLAMQHRYTASYYGLEHDNYIGSLPQSNKQHADWVDFYIQERVQPQLALAKTNGLLDITRLKKFEKIMASFHKLLITEPPALLHGDLWSGNVIVNQLGLPALIDPAVYFGNREVDLAMSRLFGGFDQDFYDSYHAHFPLNEGVEERIMLYQLYPLLVHVNLFGRSYVSQVVSILDHFV
jgi:protein-ribulosamine 3-kinase